MERTILIIEDEKLIIVSTQMVLEAVGYGSLHSTQRTRKHHSDVLSGDRASTALGAVCLDDGSELIQHQVDRPNSNQIEHAQPAGSLRGASLRFEATRGHWKR